MTFLALILGIAMQLEPPKGPSVEILPSEAPPDVVEMPQLLWLPERLDITA